MAAVEYEANRQVDLIESGGKIVQETRLFDPDKVETRSLRSKEEAHDYRYFPDPDLLPVELDEDFLADCRASLPELPDAKRRRYEQGLGLPSYNASVLTAEVETARWFEELLERLGVHGSPAEAGAQSESESWTPASAGEQDFAKRASNWVISDLFGALNRLGHGIEDNPVSPAQGAELLRLVADGTLSGTLGKQVFEIMLETGEDPGRIVEERGLRQTSDTGAIENVIAEVMAANQDKVADYRGGKDKLFGFFVGQVMKAMQGKGNPQVVNELLRKALG
jgi:aspartyl-tRNA(Asn)/glutamyl-tRNA(Gln) amidotransferase subunit B